MTTGPNLNFSPEQKTKAALGGIKVLPTNGYAQEKSGLYGDTVYTRTDGISATGTSRGKERKAIFKDDEDRKLFLDALTYTYQQIAGHVRKNSCPK